MYELTIEDKNIFDSNYMYKLQCLGKQIKKHNNCQITKYFFISHGMKYEAIEQVDTGNWDCIVSLRNVDEFLLLNDANCKKFVRETNKNEAEMNALQSGIEQGLTYGRDGFYIFKESTHQSFGGIMDSYEFQDITLEEFFELMK